MPLIEKKPIVFDDFFEKGLEENSPFLTPQSRKWAHNLSLKASIISAILLFFSYVIWFTSSGGTLYYFPLIFVYFLAGIPSLIGCIEDLCRLEINIDVLMVLAAFSSVLIGSPLEGALLLVLFEISGAMEDEVTAKAKGAISSLYKLSPTKAWVIESDDSLVERSVKDILPGTSILVKAGELVPLDGVIIKGASSLNLVHLTGENLPLTKKEGDEVPAGAKNLEGSLTLKTLRPSSDSTIARIIDLVTQAQESRPKWQQWFDKISKPYATTIILLSLGFALFIPLFFSVPFLGLEGSFYRAVAFLIAASPCALIIATPIAYLSALGVCARKGIILKGGVVLDALANCSAIAFDKTGTLTTGMLSFLAVEPLQNEDQHLIQDVLKVAVALEMHSSHPIARAIISYTEEKKIQPLSIEQFRAIHGFGVEAYVPAYKSMAYFGNPAYILPKLNETLSASLKEKMQNIYEKGEVLALLLVLERIFIFRLKDTVRPEMAETILQLKKSGKWEMMMLTGDNKVGAERVAKEVGLNEFYAELKPEDKLNIVTTLADKKGLIMVGDGINDAPALARATVGICMGKIGSTTAIEAADVVLLHDDLDLLYWLIQKAGKTQKIVKENLFLACSVILFATLPALLGWVPLWLAVVLHEGGTVLVGLNALRLLR